MAMNEKNDPKIIVGTLLLCVSPLLLIGMYFGGTAICKRISDDLFFCHSGVTGVDGLSMIVPIVIALIGSYLVLSELIKINNRKK